MTKGHDELVAHVRKILHRNIVGYRSSQVEDATEEIVQFMEIVIRDHVEYHREDVDGDWRAAIKTLSAGLPTYAMPHPMTVFDRAEEMVKELRENRP